MTGLRTFAERARVALADDHLHLALERATAQLGSRRAGALASLDQPDLVRDLARRARMEVLRDLAGQLERFEERLLENGARVHWARDADEANRIVAGIATAAGVRHVVKGKSMASEETHLNRALEQAGLEVVETDLGEYVVQLSHDRPSHIILPIIHRTREDVGRIFHERIGVPYTDDTGTLAAHAREKLRVEFLRASMGITGANFGVVENGTICLVTNEGNGRMVSTLPRVHVVLMGIEKLVPTLDDLDLLLKVLARSATGQKITTYTTLIRGPRRHGDDCGPDELHVVLLDNGRSGVLGSDVAEVLGCIRCGACLNACPVYRSIGGHAYGDTYPGPIGAVLTPALKGLADWKELPAASSLCGACRDVCPVRLDLPRMLLRLRYRASEERRSPWSLRLGMKAFAWSASRPFAYRALARLGRWGLRSLAREGWVRSGAGLLGGWTRARDLKAPGARTFQDLWRARAAGER